ncbi:MAG: leucine--tRNA ligase [Anaerolineae bacterium]|jgi:leucyl-tRNA synthetase
MTDNLAESRYNAIEIEAKWRQRWVETGLYKRVEDPERPKHYALTMLPYTSGDLHIGHWYAMAPSDARARYMRMKGYNVWFPPGFDAFGLPAENAAISKGIHPFKWTMANIEHMRTQLRAMGAMWDWDHEAITCLPEYYRWTQWFFLKFYEHGLAYRAAGSVDFCPHCNTTLAREQVWGEDRHCERCGTQVIKKDLEQWYFRITNYAQQLLDDMAEIDWPERVLAMQRNWIGRSEGAHVVFHSERGDEIPVYTTRPDTLWGASFMVLAPEHPLVPRLTTPAQREQVEAYRQAAARQSEIERLSTEKVKTGVFIGAYAINPVSQERIPIWIADYVLMAYGTGAIMGVPSHDDRDFEFALKFGLPIVPVIERVDGLAKSLVLRDSVSPDLASALSQAGLAYEQDAAFWRVTLQGAEQIDRYVELVRQSLKPGYWVDVVGARWLFIFDDGLVPFDSFAADRAILERCQGLVREQGAEFAAVLNARTTMEMLHSVEWYRDTLYHAEYGDMINSGAFSGTPGATAKETVTAWLEAQGLGHPEVNYKMHDWLISRQRYWGAPIPMVYCDACGVVPVPYEDLPVLLPEDAEFMPTGESPLRYHEGFLHTTCPKCGGPARRETDTMDTFMCSSWYHYAYVTPYHQGATPWNVEEGQYWLPVDQYTGGIEHATMHLLYTRFFTKVLHDLGLVDFDEPMKRLFCQGMILGEDNEKMSKSRGNVVNPDDYVSTLGADSVRAFLMFIGPWELGGSWSSTGIEGINRFINRVWNVVVDAPVGAVREAATPDQIRELRRWTHQAIREVTEDFEAFKFNTALAAMMRFNNNLVKAKQTAVYGTPAWQEAVSTLVLLMAPITPHVSEELWERLGRPYSVHQQRWPVHDDELAKDEEITLIVQVNGRVRARLDVPADISEQDARDLALAQPNVARALEDVQVRKVIFVPGKLLNIVAR